MRWITIQNIIIIINIKNEFKLPDPDTMYFPYGYGLNATEVTEPECPLSYYIDFPDSFSHIRIELSPNMRWIIIKNIKIIINIKYEFKLPDPDTMYFPHGYGLNATEVTEPECPLSYYMDFPDSFSHIRIELSPNMR
jgi:hypothetical protein